ncbi:hypothetical protein B0H14DRAFT_2588979 [Mycena olivaceomarginata]|nr:hypothetical protein B0H14DRAFT_2588979 [Mycena olivaceomarginata]
MNMRVELEYKVLTFKNRTSGGHYGIFQWPVFLAEAFLRKVYKPHFDAGLNTLWEWYKFTFNPTLIPGGGPVRMAPATFLTRTLQENMLAETRHTVLKDPFLQLKSSLTSLLTIYCPIWFLPALSHGEGGDDGEAVQALVHLNRHLRQALVGANMYPP